MHKLLRILKTNSFGLIITLTIALTALVMCFMIHMQIDAYKNFSSAQNIFAQQQAQDFIKMMYNYALLLKIAVLALAAISVFYIYINGQQNKALRKGSEDIKKTNDLLQRRVAAIEMSLDGVLITNAERQLKYLNQCFIDLYGLSQSDIAASMNEDWLKIFPEEAQKTLVNETLPRLKRNGEWRGEIQINLPQADNQTAKNVVIELSVTKLPDGGIVATSHDVSKDKQAEKHKKDLESQFYQAQKMEAVGRLAGGMAHDFNNILAAINGYAEFLIEDLENHPAEQKFAHKILAAGHQARELIDQILTFSRRSQPTAEYVDLVNVLDENYSMMKATAMSTIEIRQDIALDHAQISGNAVQISQAVMNLCVNALDAMEDEHGMLTIQMHKASPQDTSSFQPLLDELPAVSQTALIRLDAIDDLTSLLRLGSLAKDVEYACITISDTGSGMSKVVMEHVFEPFFTTKPVDKGTGLGLSTVHGVVAQHQGAMYIKSTLGQGTRFDLFLPLVKGAKVTAEAPPEHLQKFEFEESRVLLVEDEESVRDMAQKMLSRMGFTVLIAKDGEEALNLLGHMEEDTMVDLVLTDHSMPKMTGLELVQECQIRYPNMPFVLLSGFSKEKLSRIRGDYSAIKAVLRKPISQSLLKEKLYDVLRKEKLDAEDEAQDNKAISSVA